MDNKKLDGATLPELDRDGYLLDAGKWTREVAETLAGSEMPQDLTEDHWRVIDYLSLGPPRPSFASPGVPANPSCAALWGSSTCLPVYAICRNTGFRYLNSPKTPPKPSGRSTSTHGG